MVEAWQKAMEALTAERDVLSERVAYLTMELDNARYVNSHHIPDMMLSATREVCAEVERDAARTERDRMRPIYEKAKAWMAARCTCSISDNQEDCNITKALDELRITMEADLESRSKALENTRVEEPPVV